MDNGYNPFLHADRIAVEIGLTEPIFKNHSEKKHGYPVDESERHHLPDVEAESVGEAAKEWTKIQFPGHTRSWDDVAFSKEHWDGPMVVKGIQSVSDARNCIEVGVQGIIVSNHSGRQHDGGYAILDIFPRIVDAVCNKLDVLFDSGVKCGADAIKAIALGAKCVLVGRPYVYGLALGGEKGVKHIFRSIGGKIILNMHLAGLRSLDEIDRSILVRDDDLPNGVQGLGLSI